MPDLFVSENQNNQTPSPEKTDHKILEKVAETLPPDSPDNKVHIFTSYCEKPTGVNFNNLDDNEKILLFLRRHVITNAPWVVKAAVASLVPLLFFLLLTYFNIFLPYAHSLTLTLFYYLVLLGYLFVHFISWVFNITLITDQRVVDIDFSQLIYESVAATKLPQIEDVSYNQIGVLSSTFDYGNVSLQTAGAASNFLFAQVPHPEKVVHLINNLIAKEPHV